MNIALAILTLYFRLLLVVLQLLWSCLRLLAVVVGRIADRVSGPPSPRIPYQPRRHRRAR